MPVLAQEHLDELVVRYCDGDDSAFRALIEATNRPLRCYIAALSASADLIDEITQSTYVECFRCIDRYQPHGHFMAWLKGIAHNLLRAELRSRYRHTQATEDVIEEALTRFRLSRLDNSQGASESLLQVLRDCTASLPEKSRRLLSAFYDEDQSLKEIAQRFSKKSGTIAVTLSRIRKSIKACMERKGALE